MDMGLSLGITEVDMKENIVMEYPHLELKNIKMVVYILDM